MAPPSRELTPDRSARHLFGYQLRVMRKQKGWSLEKLASEAHSSRSHLARIEAAEYMPPPELPARLDELFGTGELFAGLYALACKESHPDHYQRLMELEARARVIEEFSPATVPGLIQTEAYARAALRVGYRRPSEEDVNALVAARMSRQRLLRGDCPVTYSAILDETVFRRSVGGPVVMREQLTALLDLVDTRTTVLQVLPYSHGEHALMNGVLRLMTLDDDVSVAYEEGIDTGTLLEDSENVSIRQRTYDLLRSHALSPSETAAFIRSVRENYTA
ncbi:Scr1 family TA system antitoxin-like transcriptional regulator [Streptomyces sp. 2MCAF27]